jgi:membrane dipeptidase
MFTIDAHLDLSLNALEYNRDLQRPITEIRKREKHLTDKPDRGRNTVSLPELRTGNIGLVVATQIARYVSPTNPLSGWHSSQQAWAHTQGQLAWYKAMEDIGEMIQITDSELLEKHLLLWQNDKIANQDKPIGYILSLEGADSLINVHYVEQAYRYGLRAIGPAHYGPGRYAQGTDATGLMGAKGRELLKEMDRLNIILDVTHLCDDSFWEALTHFNGHLWASHHLCRSLVNHNRQLSDDMIKAIIERGGVIGGALDAWMMVSGWLRGKSDPKAMNCGLETLIDHYDHICQIAGNTNHIGIGTDLDGMFGTEQCPYDLETIADIQKLPNLFRKRGYSELDIQNIMHGNWLRFLNNAWKKQ